MVDNSGPEPLSSITPLKQEELDFLTAVAKRAFQSVLHHPREIYLKTAGGRNQPLKKLYVASLAFTRLESHGFCCGEPLTAVMERTYSVPGLSSPFCEARLFEVDLGSLSRYQAQSYQQNGIFSSSFSAIINGGPYSLRDVPE